MRTQDAGFPTLVGSTIAMAKAADKASSRRQLVGHSAINGARKNKKTKTRGERKLSSYRQRIFNAKERVIVQAEIDKIITTGVIVPSSPEQGDCVSAIFLPMTKNNSIVLS